MGPDGQIYMLRSEEYEIRFLSGIIGMGLVWHAFFDLPWLLSPPLEVGRCVRSKL